MKDLLNKAFSLGLGLAASTKDQAEKLAQELSTRGEMSKSDSQAFVKGMIERGQEARLGIENSVKERMRQTAEDLNLATRDEIRRLEERIARLEEKLGITVSGTDEDGSVQDESAALTKSSALTEAPGLSTVAAASGHPATVKAGTSAEITEGDGADGGGDGRADESR
ncbi:phasin family protein [Paenibacillus beijingensis]|uniref:phasin family protein n=1 Tax=Paenibacillus beijingensis TaxID=1126833 RepID=UPI000698B9E2|nr:hypothetical protein [Paenibacillus beijingensis]